MNKNKFKNVEYVFPISNTDEFAKIACHHEDLQRNYHKHETYFLNAHMEVIAHFECSKPFYVRQLSKNVGNLFLLHDIFDGNYKIVRVENCKHEVIYSCQDIEQGVENGCFAVKNNNLWGFLNEDGTEVIKPQYEDYCAFASNLAAIKKDGKWGFINKSNETITPFEYEIHEFSSFLGDFAPVGKNGKFGYIDKTGKIIIPIKYEATDITYPKAEIFPVKNNDKWGFVDNSENVVIPFEYDNVECNCDGYSIYHIMKKIDEKELYGLVDARRNKVIIPCDYLSLCPNPNSIQARKKNGKYIQLNWNGDNISQEYDFIDEYCMDGLYKVSINEKYGFINETGQCIIQPTYHKWSEDFYGGYALIINLDFSKSIIDKLGKHIMQIPKMQNIYNIGNGSFLIENANFKEYEIINLRSKNNDR